MSAAKEDACEAIAATEVVDMPDGTKAAIVCVVGSLRTLQAKVLEFEKARGHFCGLVFAMREKASETRARMGRVAIVRRP